MIPSPRDIQLFKNIVMEVLYPRFDVLWLKYYPEIEAYQKARRFFLNSKQKYTHFVILPDDLIVNREGIDILINEIENSGRFYPVLSGICNYSCIPHQSTRTVSAKMVIPDSINGKKSSISFIDQFITFQELDFLNDDVFQVLFNGFSCEFIHRHVLENVDFRTEKVQRGGIDTYFSFDLESLGISQYIHKKARFLHLKGFMNSEINTERIYTGEKPPTTIFHDYETRK